jgi:Bacterial Ig-like domain (group 2)
MITIIDLERTMPAFPTLRRIGITAIVAFSLLAGACSDDNPAAPEPLVSRLQVTPPAGDLYVGDVITLNAVLRDSTGAVIPNAPILWSVSDTLRGQLGTAGILTVLKTGDLVVTARSGGHVATRTLSVRGLTVQAVTINPGMTTLQLQGGDVVVLGVRVQGEGGRLVLGKAVQLRVDDARVATIDAAGRVRAVTPGVTMVRATADGVTGTLRVEVAPEPAVLTLSHLGQSRLPLLVHADSVMWDGQREYHEVYLETGKLTLLGGAPARYEIEARYVEYDVRTVNGRRTMQIRLQQREYDRGLVQYDARGDLLMTSEYISPLSHTASSESGGIRVRFRVPGDDEILDLFYRREPR